MILFTTGTTGRWRSKWNKYPLMEHNWDDTPYGTTNLKYYVRTNVADTKVIDNVVLRAQMYLNQ